MAHSYSQPRGMSRMTGASRGNGYGKMAGLLAIGAVAGVALTQARKAAVQGPSVVAGDWMEALKTEHRMVEKLFDKLLATDDSQTTKRNMLLGKIAYALTKHANEEENTIYPALKQHGLEPRSDHLFDDHAKIKSFIYELKNAPASDPNWLMRAREFQQLIMHHVREEEDEIFPALRARLSDAENHKLTTMMNWEGYKVA